MKGTLPSELGKLTQLQEIYLEGNNLNGNIPSEVGSLKQLERLFLYDNKLTGKIPSEVGLLESINDFEVELNNLTGEIPTEVGLLSNVEVLLMFSNNLTGPIPKEIGNLDNLQVLKLHENNLEGSLPSELGNLFMLERFSAYKNNIKGSIPLSYENLAHLDSFDVTWGNDITGDHTFMCAIENVTMWYVCTEVSYDDDCECCECWDLSSDIKVETCDEDNAKYESIEDLLQSETNFEKSFVENSITPQGLALEWLSSLSEDQIKICNTYGVIEKYVLAVLYYSTDGHDWLEQMNFLTSGDPCEWYKFDFVNVYSGVLCDRDSGTITSINLRKLIEFFFFFKNNYLIIFIQHNTHLFRFISIINKSAGNKLNGTIPNELGLLTELREINLNNNGLTGTLPLEITNLSGLAILSLDRNELRGNLVTEFGELTSLTDLSLMDNQLSGIIPTELGDSYGLKFLQLGKNNFEGNIPSELGRLYQLKRLYLYSNTLTGKIPTEMGFLDLLTDFGVDNNQLTGTIPSELGLLSNVADLDMFMNNLTGPIPTELGNMDNLQHLKLQENNLRGSLPSELGNLIMLERFAVYQNSLTGTVPTSYENLANLDSFDVTWGNDIAGDFSFICDIANATIWYVCADEELNFDCECCECWEYIYVPAVTCDPESAEYDSVESLLRSEANITNDISGNVNTPQGLAIEWLKSLSEDKLQLCNTYGVIEKYVLAVLYYSTNGDQWTSDIDFLSDEHICSWTGFDMNSTYMGLFCDDTDNIRSLNIGKKIIQNYHVLIFVLYFSSFVLFFVTKSKTFNHCVFCLPTYKFAQWIMVLQEVFPVKLDFLQS